MPLLRFMKKPEERKGKPLQVEVAESAGFCFGVKRAVDMVYKEAKKADNVYTYGPIIHNETVVDDLKQKGVQVIESLEDLEKLKEGTVIIRSHGVEEKLYRILEQKNIHVVDATCPFVKKIHHIVKEESKKGRRIVIIGNAKHPEVEGIKGWCKEDAVVIESCKEAQNSDFLPDEKLCVVSQTTFNYKNFEDIVEILSKKSYDILAMNTICNATEKRQTEAARLAARSEAMLVIGGKHSSNTQKLYEICKRECEDTYHIQTLDDLDLNLFKSFRSVGITAGASTPNNIIEEVQSYVRVEQ